MVDPSHRVSGWIDFQREWLNAMRSNSRTWISTTADAALTPVTSTSSAVTYKHSKFKSPENVYGVVADLTSVGGKLCDLQLLSVWIKFRRNWILYRRISQLELLRLSLRVKWI